MGSKRWASGGMLAAWLTAAPVAWAQPYPPSEIIVGVTFDASTHDRRAPGSDNWPITWADDDHQYTSWGDGGGFGGTNNDGRVSLGFARVEGTAESYTGFNVWGGKDPEAQATFDGKSYGILSVDGTLYAWRAPGSNNTNYQSQRIYVSSDKAHSWAPLSWELTIDDGMILPTFLQFGKDYAGARDGFVYSYAIRLQDASGLMVQKPGMIDLMRAPIDALDDRNALEFFAGLDGNGAPTWTDAIDARVPVFEDPAGVGWNVSVSFNAPLGRYLLCTEHDETFTGKLGIFDAPEPWGPWTTVGYYDDWAGMGSTFFWNFANKWLSDDGLDFTLVFTGVGENDSWNSMRGSFDAVPGATGAGGGSASSGAGGSGGGAAGPTAGSGASSNQGEPFADDGGCGCRVAAPRRGPAWVLAALLLASWRRGRRTIRGVILAARADARGPGGSPPPGCRSRRARRARTPR